MPVDRSSRVLPETPLAMDRHPLYRLRKAIIIAAAIGIVLSFSSVGPYVESVYGSLAFLFILSAIFCALDLRHYAERLARNPDQTPAWPQKSWMAGDLILVILLFGGFFAGLAGIEASPHYYHNAPIDVARSYAALVCLVNS
jgi:hypothetical protein